MCCWEIIGPHMNRRLPKCLCLFRIKSISCLQWLGIYQQKAGGLRRDASECELKKQQKRKNGESRLLSGKISEKQGSEDINGQFGPTGRASWTKSRLKRELKPRAGKHNDTEWWINVGRSYRGEIRTSAGAVPPSSLSITSLFVRTCVFVPCLYLPYEYIDI